MIRRPPRSTLSSSSAASDVYKRQVSTQSTGNVPTSMRLFTVALALASQLSSAYECTRVTKCNGVMCDDICQAGSVQTDPRVDTALKFQRELQMDEPLVRTTMMGTHNSAISQAYGFGIEQDFIQNLTGIPMYQGDDLGEGVCQSISVLDQLRMGLRHIEIDINSGWDKLHFDKIFVCHSPVGLAPGLVLKVEAAALEKGIKLGWDTSKLSCLGTNVPYKDMLLEIKGWMDENPEEIVILYLDAKPGCVLFPSQTSAAYADMVQVFGTTIWGVADGDPLAASRREFLRRGKRVVFENHADGWKKTAHGEPILVFTPDLWSHQFGNSSLHAFPNCSIDSDPHSNWYAPVNYNGTGQKRYELVRGLEWGRVTKGQGADMTKGLQCGTNIFSPNYIEPEDMTGMVWALDLGESWDLQGNGCVALLPSGRWGLVQKEQCLSQRPTACRATNDDSRWELGMDAGSPCPDGFVLAAPTNDYANSFLKIVAQGQTVYLPVHPNGTSYVETRST
eukprot:TRINITY_DN1608_c0_g4_i7.p1 TRINITY_DN1608_c0_g4~~TRINITY_DN1608_c0_g4_i7.p1  ORF type:complete len:506 (+),score=98.03 TRINITY_DN1608_c0_g4_i7:125-1642(+)